METTKTGIPITFERRLDVEGDKNRGWVAHTLIARVDGEEAGYLSVSYIPQDRFKARYRTVLDYMRHIKGWCLGEEPSDLASLRAWVSGLGGYLYDTEAMGYGIDLDSQPEA